MNYKVQDITEISFKIENNLLKLGYAPIIESLYYSPGVNYKVYDDHVIIDIVRCNINDKCKVDAEASQGAINVVSIKTEGILKPSKIFINEAQELNSIANLAMKENNK